MRFTDEQIDVLYSFSFENESVVCTIEKRVNSTSADNYSQNRSKKQYTRQVRPN